MQISANVAAQSATKTTSSVNTPGVKPNGSDDNQPISFAEFEQRLEQPSEADDKVAEAEQPPSAELPQPPSSEELALQIEQLLAQAAPKAEQAPQDIALPGQAEIAPGSLPTALTGEVALAEPGKPGQLEQLTPLAVPAQGRAASLAKEALAPTGEQVPVTRESLPLAKAASLPANEIVLPGKDLQVSVDSALVDKLAVATQAAQPLHMHTAMGSPINVSAQPAMAPSSAEASAATSQHLQASVDITEPEWGRDLVEQLRSRLQLSKTDKIQHAHVRLDPPELGRLEVNLRLDGDKVSVHFTAAHPQLREALAANADRLRLDFDGSQMQLADVSVSSGLYQQSQQQSGADDEPGVMANHVVAPQEEAASTSVPGMDGQYEAMV